MEIQDHLRINHSIGNSAQMKSMSTCKFWASVSNAGNGVTIFCATIAAASQMHDIVRDPEVLSIHSKDIPKAEYQDLYQKWVLTMPVACQNLDLL
jgi:hypothetical protein